MKNKLCYILLGILISFSFMRSVFAKELDFTVTATPSETTVVKGKETEITLNLKSDSPIDACQFQVIADTSVEFVSWSTANGWDIGMGTISNFTLENSVDNVEPLTNGENVLLIRYKVNGDGKVTIKTIECASVVDASNSSSGTHEDVIVSLTTKEVNEDTTLSKLEVTGGTLLTPITTPTDNNIYLVKLNSSKFGLNATASNPDYQNTIVFKDEENNVISDPSNITFRDDSGQSQMLISIDINNKTMYTLFLNYEQAELDNSLKSLTIDGVNLNLVDGQYEYEYTIGKDITSFNVSATVTDSDNFKIGDDSNAPGEFSIKDFVDIIIVVEPVSSELGASIATYTVRVTKEGALVDDSKDDSSSNNKPSSGGSNNSNSNGNVNSNPTTGDISMFVMAVILIASLVGSVILYQKNLQSYE